MMLILQIIFWTSLLALVHSYILYPLIAQLSARGKQREYAVFSPEDETLPFVSMIISVFNEEDVILEKLKSIDRLDYPRSKMQVLIGSDASTDHSNEIIETFAGDHEYVSFYPFEQRRGKPHVVNDLAARAIQDQTGGRDHIFLITDANVILSSESLYHLVKHFRNPDIALVDSHMVHTGLRTEGISRSENKYISREVRLKHWEGKAWGRMIGPFGGCYALRSDHYIPVPGNFLVDDFFIAMHALERGALAINDLDAVCYEAVSHEIKEEYKRKSRISAGNFQNLKVYGHLIWPIYRPLGFAFLSHKVLRWFGPIFILVMIISSGVLAMLGNQLYTYLFMVSILLVVVVPLVELFLRKLGLNSYVLRTISYFNIMNVALLEGMIKYFNGIRNNVWEPPKRSRVISPE